MTLTQSKISQDRKWALINGLNASLAEVEQAFPEWLKKWRADKIGQTSQQKWDQYNPECITQGPQWDYLMADPECDVLRIMLDRCLERIWGQPGCVSLVRLRWAVKILRLRPDLVRGYSVGESLLIRLQGLLAPNIHPDGVSYAEWRRLLARSLRVLTAIPALELEFQRCLRMMENSTQHPQRAGFFQAVAEGTKLIHGKEFCREKLRRLNHVRVTNYLQSLREEPRVAVAA